MSKYQPYDILEQLSTEPAPQHLVAVRAWRDALVAELERWSDYYSETFGMSEKPMRDAKAEAYRHAARLVRGER